MNNINSAFDSQGREIGQLNLICTGCIHYAGL